MSKNYNEYGGFLPLELDKKEEYYKYNRNQIFRFNSGKAAIVHVLKNIKNKEVWIPYYLCPNVCKEIEKNVERVQYYHIDKELLPIIEANTDACILIVDYFGIMDNKVECFVKEHKKATIIIDNSHAFFHVPIMRKNVYNIYSCKKFFGVPDGAYLIGETLEGNEPDATYASEYALYLLQCLEYGTNHCYSEKKMVDGLLAERQGGMSVLTRKLLESVNYKKVMQKRHYNYKLYEKEFGFSNMISIEKNSIPYMYPFHVQKDVKKELIERKIYVPTLWGHLVSEKYQDMWEYKLSRETLFLPVDQRYDSEDIYYIIDNVKQVLEINHG